MLSIVIATVLSMIVGELVPQFLAFSEPVGTGRIVIPVPDRVHGGVPSDRLGAQRDGRRRPCGSSASGRREELSGARSAEELVALVRRSASEGGLEHDTATLLTGTLRFSAHTAADVMTPRPRLETVDKSDTAEDVIELARRTGHSRFPVEGRLAGRHRRGPCT